MRSMIFTAESVRAIQKKRKTETRRIVPSGWLLEGGMKGYPFGRKGMQFYVKETWQLSYEWESNGYEELRFFDGKLPADFSELDARLEDANLEGLPETYHIRYRADEEFSDWKWRSPLFMPEWASRFIMKITDVGFEYLNDITPADCMAEGCPLRYANAMQWFKNHWNKINGSKSAYESNPAVAVIKFHDWSSLDEGKR